MAFASNGTRLLPSGGIYTFSTAIEQLSSVFASVAATLSQALCEAALGKGLLGGFGCGALSGLTHKYRPAPL